MNYFDVRINESISSMTQITTNVLSLCQFVNNILLSKFLWGTVYRFILKIWILFKNYENDPQYEKFNNRHKGFR